MQINVLYSTDSCYVQYAYASINSLLFNNANIDNIKIYLIEDNLADFEKENIQSLICKYKNAEIKFIDINTIMNNSGIVKKDFFKLVGYSRLFIQDIINVDKILYLDCDTIVANNLLELWNIDINDYLIAGVQDTVLEYSKTIVGMDMNTRYINSGVLLINLKKWREENIKNKFLKMINDFNGYVPLHDQGIVNGVCKGKIFYLNPKFNCMSQFYQFSEKQIKKLYNIKSFYSKKEICNAIQYPVIIHYIAKFYNRPWCEDCSHPKKEEYFKYCNNELWKRELVKSNKNIKKSIRKTIFNHIPFAIYLANEKLLDIRRKNILRKNFSFLKVNWDNGELYNVDTYVKE